MTSFGHFSRVGSSRRRFYHRISVDIGDSWYKKSIQCFRLDWPRIPRFCRDSSQRKSLALRARDLLEEESLQNRGIRGQSSRKHWIPSIYAISFTYAWQPLTGSAQWFLLSLLTVERKTLDFLMFFSWFTQLVVMSGGKSTAWHRSLSVIKRPCKNFDWNLLSWTPSWVSLLQREKTVIILPQ